MLRKIEVIKLDRIGNSERGKYLEESEIRILKKSIRKNYKRDVKK